MLNLTRKFLADNIQRCRDTIKFHDKKKEASPVRDVSEPEPALPTEVLWAKAQLDAYIKIANFISDDVEEINPKMNNEEACRTATELFIDKALEDSFDWSKVPTTVAEAEKLLESYPPDKSDFSKGFMIVVYFWYKFQRKKKENKP